MHALLACLLISTAYVAPFYFQRRLARSHSQTIIFRTLSTFAVCLVAWLPLTLTISRTLQVSESGEGRELVLQLLGLRLEGTAAAAILPNLLTATLFLGPLSLLALKWRSGEPIEQLNRNPLQWWREIVVGPVTEEFCFRACMLPLLLLQGYSHAQSVLLTPLFFGVAHLHHAYDFVVHQGCTLSEALLLVGFQAGFTTVFGWYASFLLLRTGHFTAPLCAHALCNFMGFPDFPAALSHPRAVILRRLYITGILAFAVLLAPMTEPSLYGNMMPLGDSKVNKYAETALRAAAREV